jgi:uncharacterized protein DUF4123
MPTMDYQALERVLWPKGRSTEIWMIVDAARDRRIFGLLLEHFYSDHACLFGNALPPELEIAAPYLIPLEYQGAATRRFLTQAAGNAWGIYLKSDQGRHRLRAHLTDLLIVQGPNRDRLLFRYFDPRVLRTYLPTCLPDELETVFGRIECFWMEDEKRGALVRASIERRQLALNEVSLAS